MYGMVMMMAVAGSGDVSSFGNRGGSCHGTPVVASAGCHGGCHGGGLLSKIKEKLAARHSCHGSSAAPVCPAPAPACPAPAAECHAAPACAPAAHGHVAHSDGCALAGAPIGHPVVVTETPKEMPKAVEPKKEEPKKEEPKKDKKES